MTVTAVNQLPDGRIASLSGEIADGDSKAVQTLDADFFIDCTGFRANLLQQYIVTKLPESQGSSQAAYGLTADQFIASTSQ